SDTRSIFSEEGLLQDLNEGSAKEG
ncbi:unnamed protein product, partial [Allacma fusca]